MTQNPSILPPTIEVPVSTLQRKYTDIIDLVSLNKNICYLTKHGKRIAVISSVDIFEKLIEKEKEDEDEPRNFEMLALEYAKAACTFSIPFLQEKNIKLADKEIKILANELDLNVKTRITIGNPFKITIKFTIRTGEEEEEVLINEYHEIKPPEDGPPLIGESS